MAGWRKKHQVRGGKIHRKRREKPVVENRHKKQAKGKMKGDTGHRGRRG